MTETSYKALVRLPTAAYPRGGIWMFFVWYSVVYLLFLFEAKPSPPLGIVAFAVLGFGAAGLTWILSRSGSQSFEASSSGIRLGRVGKVRELPWTEIQELRISAMKRGALLEILVAPSASVARRGLARQLADLAFFTFPLVGARRYTPALLVPLADPPRYRIPLVNVTDHELSTALAERTAATAVTVSG